MSSEEKFQLTGYISVKDEARNLRSVEKWEILVEMDFVDGCQKWISSGNFTLKLDGQHVNPTRNPSILEIAATGELLTIVLD